MDVTKPWIATPHLRPDYRGPTDRAYMSFPDPAVGRPIISMLESVASRRPEHIAVESHGECLTFKDLWQAVCRLHSTIEANESDESPVAILLPPGAAYVVAVFAILAAKRLCLLLDQGYPSERNAKIAVAARSKRVVVSSDVDGDAWPGITRIPVTSAFDKTIAVVSPTHEPLALDEPAFILCTSGSAGLPKSIVHSQRTMLHWVRAVSDAIHLGVEDRVLSIASPSTLSGLVPLLACPLTGATMQMLDIGVEGFTGLLKVLSTRPVTILRVAPSFLRTLARVPGAASAFARLRLVQLAGEPLLKADLAESRKLLGRTCLIRSTYGSTEASGLSWFAGEPDDFDPFHSATGILMPDTTALIVDDDNRPCAVGEAGELVIRSRYNSLGEWDGSRVVGTMFEASSADDGTRIYRTGDIARFHRDGVFVVLGRKDRMVKMNGQRAEPAEIEVALRKSPEIMDAAVLPYTRASSTKLAAFVVPTADAGVDLATRLDADLRAVLPGFAVPSRILILSVMPRLPGGKIDAQQLRSLAEKDR